MRNAIRQNPVTSENSVAYRDKFEIRMAFDTITASLTDDAIARDADFQHFCGHLPSLNSLSLRRSCTVIQKDRIYAVSDKGITLADSLREHFRVRLHHMYSTCHFLFGTNLKYLV